MKHGLTVAVILITCSALAFAGQSCVTATVVPADGRVVDFDFVLNGTSNFYQFAVTQNHSYSVEVRQDYDDPPSTLTVSLASENTTCTTALNPVATSTITTEPALPANAFRSSFTAASTGVYSITVQNTGGAGRYVSVSVSETTVFGPNFSTFGTFITQFNFQNTTSQTIHGVLVVTPTVTVPAPTAPPKTVNFTLNPFGGAGLIAGPAGDAVIPVNSGGFVSFTHDGPPGSVLTQAQFLNSSATVIVPSKFQSVRESAH